MEKMINFVKDNKKALGKGAMIVGGGIAVAVLTKLGLQPVEEEIVVYEDISDTDDFIEVEVETEGEDE